jgi:hypothetical protein
MDGRIARPRISNQTMGVSGNNQTADALWPSGSHGSTNFIASMQAEDMSSFDLLVVHEADDHPCQVFYGNLLRYWI